MKYVLNFRLIIILSLIITIASCKKNSGISLSGPGVYVAGYQQNISNSMLQQNPYIWKNGIGEKLQLPDTIHSLNISSAYGTSSHFYVTGNVNTNYGERAVLWDNGSMHFLNPVSAGSFPDDYTSGITVSGNDVYISGGINGNSGYWKNGTFTVLDNSGTSTAGSIAVSGTDVYMCGSINTSPVLWKNNNPTYLSPDSVGYATSIFISGNDVYVGGILGDSSWSNIWSAVYWKNGTLVNLSVRTPYTNVNAINLSGNDVYVAGVVNNMATLWKNGLSFPLLLGSYSNASGIAVKDNDVYVSGYIVDPLSGLSTAGYWKNQVFTGFPIENDSASTIASAIFVR